MRPPQEELDALFAEYRAALPARVTRFEALLAEGKLKELAREAHSLGGSAGTFGLPRVGEAARAVEDSLARRHDPAEVRRLLEHLKREIRSP